jgi:membrane associated rhomboid family serine protease
MEVLDLILIVTIVLSIQGFKKQKRLERLWFSPYRFKHHNEYWRILTHAFVHADWGHLLINMFVLYNFGAMVEGLMVAGAWGEASWLPVYGFSILYFGGIFAAALPALQTKRDRPNYASLGASGAVAAVIFAFIIRFPSEQLLLFFIIPIPAWLAGIGYLAYEYWQTGKRSRIAHDAHLGGAVFGIIFTALTVTNALPNFLEVVLGR